MVESIWKICSSNWKSSPICRVNIKNLWNYQPVNCWFGALVVSPYIKGELLITISWFFFQRKQSNGGWSCVFFVWWLFYGLGSHGMKLTHIVTTIFDIYETLRPLLNPFKLRCADWKPVKITPNWGESPTNPATPRLPNLKSMEWHGAPANGRK